MLLQAANAIRGSVPSPAAGASPNSSLLLSESQQSIGGPPPLMEKLTPREREVVLKQGRRKVRGQTLFNQGTKHDGIYLIESGRIRVFYTSPLGREITLAYWRAGNFVGGPEIFGGGIHQWSGIASSNASVVQLPGRELRALATEIPNLAIGLIEGLTFKGKCYSALRKCSEPVRSPSGWRICCYT
jgi:CRP-like cAMP-binding protein